MIILLYTLMTVDLLIAGGDYRPDLYTGEGVGTLTWVDNQSSYYKGWNTPHFGIAEIPICN